MATQLTPSVESSGLHTLLVSDLLDLINHERGENNDDFLDGTSLLGYINRASDYLNTKTDLKARLKSTTCAINTNTTKFYAFSTLVSLGDFERIQQLRLDSDLYRDYPFVNGRDYCVEPNPSGNGQGVRFMVGIDTPIQILYYSYIQKITDEGDNLPLSPNSNNYYVAKVLEYVYRSESRDDRANLYKQLAEEGIDQLTFNNLYEQDGVVLPNANFAF